MLGMSPEDPTPRHLAEELPAPYLPVQLPRWGCLGGAQRGHPKGRHQVEGDLELSLGCGGRECLDSHDYL